MADRVNCAHGYNSRIDAMWGANYIMIGFKVHSEEEIHSRGCKSGQELTIGDLKDLG